MSNTKTQFRFFTIPEYDKEQEYLRGMHRQGWRLVRVNLPGFYHFEACEPEDVVYQLDYNRDGAANRAEYVHLFRDCGWEYLFDFVGYSYFRKPAAQMSGREEIFCDDDSRLEMMKRVFRGRMIPLIVIFLAVLVPQLIRRLTGNGLGDVFEVFLTAMFGTLFLLYAGLFIQFAVQYRRTKRRLS